MGVRLNAERQSEPRDLYKEAQEFAQRQVLQEEAVGPGAVEMSEMYWAAWYAARQAAGVLLEKAAELGLTEEQMEALRQTAADIAYD